MDSFFSEHHLRKVQFLKVISSTKIYFLEQKLSYWTFFEKKEDFCLNGWHFESHLLHIGISTSSTALVKSHPKWRTFDSINDFPPKWCLCESCSFLQKTSVARKVIQIGWLFRIQLSFQTLTSRLTIKWILWAKLICPKKYNWVLPSHLTSKFLPKIN